MAKIKNIISVINRRTTKVQRTERNVKYLVMCLNNKKANYCRIFYWIVFLLYGQDKLYVIVSNSFVDAKTVYLRMPQNILDKNPGINKTSEIEYVTASEDVLWKMFLFIHAHEFYHLSNLRHVNHKINLYTYVFKKRSNIHVCDTVLFLIRKKFV